MNTVLNKTKEIVGKDFIEICLDAYRLMCTAKRMAELYDENKDVCSKYVHSTSRGHEAIQIAAGFQLKPIDYASPYYRDESILLAIGLAPYELMLQLMAKRDDPFSGGRSYYGHPSLRRKGFPVIPHQSFSYRHASHSCHRHGTWNFLFGIARIIERKVSGTFARWVMDQLLKVR